MNWIEATKAVTPYVVKIQTPGGYGTGFLFAYNNSRTIAAIVTALHVVQSADDWRQPIKIALERSTPAFVTEEGRVVFSDAKRDSASILLPATSMNFPKELLPLGPKDKFRAPGGPVGWLGYPAIAPSKLCFFKGHTSAFETDGDYYLIDGVAINGVSGGPVFDASGPPMLLGMVSAYSANFQRGEALPGMLVAHDLTHAHDLIERLKDMDAAREEKAKQPDTPSAASQTPAALTPRETPVGPIPDRPAVTEPPSSSAGPPGPRAPEEAPSPRDKNP